MTPPSQSSHAPHDAWDAFRRVFPTALAVMPVAMLFGILASQANWSPVEVFLISALGFTGSGQFALLPLASKEVGFLTMLLVAASINSRYLPIAYISSPRLPPNPAVKVYLAHLLGDEAYAVERAGDSHRAIVVIRTTIFAAWVASSCMGALVARLFPAPAWGAGVNAGFPASVVLLYLSFSQLKVRLAGSGRLGMVRLLAGGVCVIAAVLLIHLLGPVYFWIPSIFLSTAMLWKAKA